MNLNNDVLHVILDQCHENSLVELATVSKQWQKVLVTRVWLGKLQALERCYPGTNLRGRFSKLPGSINFYQREIAKFLIEKNSIPAQGVPLPPDFKDLPNYYAVWAQRVQQIGPDFNAHKESLLAMLKAGYIFEVMQLGCPEHAETYYNALLKKELEHLFSYRNYPPDVKTYFRIIAYCWCLNNDAFAFLKSMSKWVDPSGHPHLLKAAYTACIGFKKDEQAFEIVDFCVGRRFDRLPDYQQLWEDTDDPDVMEKCYKKLFPEKQGLTDRQMDFVESLATVFGDAGRTEKAEEYKSFYAWFYAPKLISGT